jgi:hypothetical protein
MPACDKCNGVGIVEHKGKLRECLCAFLRRKAAEMPPYIRKAQVKPPHLELPVINAINQSLYIITSWADLKAVIKVIMIKYPQKFVRITSDREIRDVFVGATSRSARGEDDEGKVFNTLQDLMDLPDLVIVRLNELFYKNKAAPGALLEAVSFRVDRDRPTWVISDTDKPFTSKSYAWSDSFIEFVSSSFAKTIIPSILPKTIIDDSIFGELRPIHTPAKISPVATEAAKRPVTPQSVPATEEPENPKESQEEGISNPVNPLAIYGKGLNKPKFSGRY